MRRVTVIATVTAAAVAGIGFVATRPDSEPVPPSATPSVSIVPSASPTSALTAPARPVTDSAGVIVYNDSYGSSRGRSSPIGVFDLSGAVELCARPSAEIRIAWADRSRIVYERLDREGEIWSVASTCDSSPELLFTMPSSRRIKHPEITCIVARPGGLLSVIFAERRNDFRRKAFLENPDGTWSDAFTDGRCAWATDRLGVSAWHIGGTSPYLYDASTNEVELVEHPMLLTGVFSPGGAYSYSPHAGRGPYNADAGKIFDLRTGGLVDDPRGNDPPYEPECCHERPQYLSPWSPDGSRILAPRYRRVWDLSEDTSTSVFDLHQVEWIDNERIVGRTPDGSAFVRDLSTGQRVRLESPLPPRFGLSFVAGFAPIPDPLRLEIVDDETVPTQTYRNLLRFPVAPAWIYGRCTPNGAGHDLRGTGCEVEEYRFDRQLTAPALLWEEVDPLSFGWTSDGVATVVDRLTEDQESCEDGENANTCMSAATERTTLAGVDVIKVTRYFWEWSHSIFVGRVGDRTFLVQTGWADLDEHDPPVAWILERAEVVPSSSA